MASTPTPPTANPSLQDRIQTLTDVHNRLEALRHGPAMLLRPPSASPLADFPAPFDPRMDREFGATFNASPAHDFCALKEFVALLCSDKVQEALGAAGASEEADPSELGECFLREHRKRKRPPSPVGSPQPYVPSPPRSSSLLGYPEDDPPAVRAESLLEFVREFEVSEAKLSNAGSRKCTLAIWSRTETIRDELKRSQGGRLTSPVVLRFRIPDVLTAYISLVFTRTEEPLVVESVSAFGPRERRLPHEQSEYLAFQGLTQHMGKMLLSRPRAGVRTVMDVLVSYRGLFVERCTSCERVLSTEGHVPPVARMWAGERWQARHGTCQ